VFSGVLFKELWLARPARWEIAKPSDEPGSHRYLPWTSVIVCGAIIGGRLELASSSRSELWDRQTWDTKSTIRAQKHRLSSWGILSSRALTCLWRSSCCLVHFIGPLPVCLCPRGLRSAIFPDIGEFSRPGSIEQAKSLGSRAFLWVRRAPVLPGFFLLGPFSGMSIVRIALIWLS